MSNMHTKCQACMQNVKYECKMSKISVKCQAWVQNIKHECKMSVEWHHNITYIVVDAGQGQIEKRIIVINY